jgi:hypothetical protein
MGCLKGSSATAYVETKWHEGDWRNYPVSFTWKATLLMSVPLGVCTLEYLIEHAEKIRIKFRA